MPLPASGPISMANIRDEFGDTNPISLNEFYAGGGKVPAGTSGAQGVVPSSGEISIGTFYGLSGSLLTGAGWISSPTPAFSLSQDIVNAGGTLVCINSGYVIRSNDSGSTWVRTLIESISGLYYGPTLIVPGYATASLSSLLYFDGVLYAIAKATYAGGDNYYLVKSNDLGSNWVAVMPDFFTRDSSVPRFLVGYTLGYEPMILAPYYHLGSGSAYYAMFCYAINLVSKTVSFGQVSTPGSSWIINTVFIPGSPAAAPLGGDGLLIEAKSRSEIYTGVDGVNWTRRYVYDTNGNVQTSTSTVGNPALVHDGRYLVSSTPGSTIVSTNGTNFTLYDNVFPDINTSYPLFDSCGDYALAVWRTTAGVNMISISTDLLSWEHRVSSTLAASHQKLLHTSSYWVLKDSDTAFKRAPL